MTTFALLAVVLLPVLSALVIALLPDRHDDGKRLGSLSIVFTLLTLLAMVYVAATADGSTVTVPVMRLSFWAGGFQKLYGLVVCFMWFVSALLSPQYFHGHHHLKRYFSSSSSVWGSRRGCSCPPTCTPPSCSSS